jgi:hypothetical protein
MLNVIRRFPGRASRLAEGASVVASLARTTSARFSARCSRLRGCESGLAFVEFALALPVLTTLVLVGLETANLAMAHLRISNIAMLASDNASRVRDGIDESDVVELLTGAKMTGDSIGFRQHGRIILSSIEPNAAGPNGTSTGQWIRWQRCDGAKTAVSNYGAEGTGQNSAVLQQVGVAGSQIAATSGTAIMVVEAVYDYQPLVSSTIFGARTIRYESAFNVRQRTNQAITNNGPLPLASRKLCTTYAA